MFDAKLRPLIDPPLNQAGAWLAKRGISANSVTLTGFLVGLLVIPLVALHLYWAGFLVIVINRLFDGLDGAIARAQGISNQGGYLDITLDFLFYASIPLAFALADPQTNGLAAAFLLFCYIGTGSSFLAFAIMAEKLDLQSEEQGKKSLFYLPGLAEGFETILFSLLFCVFPGAFVWLAFAFGNICLITTASRIIGSYYEIGRVETATRMPQS